MTLSGTCRTGDERCERELSALSLAGRTLEGPLELGALLEETGEGRLDLVDGLCGMDRSLTRERRGWAGAISPLAGRRCRSPRVLTFELGLGYDGVGSRHGED